MLQKIVAMFITFFLILTGAETPGAPEASLKMLQCDQQNIQQQIDNSSNEINEYEQNSDEHPYEYISTLNNQVNLLNSLMENLEKQNDIINKEIISTESKIKDTENQVTELNNRINQKQKEIDKLAQVYMKRLRAQYISGNITVLEMLFSSNNSITSFINKLELIERVKKNDEKNLKLLTDGIEAMQPMKEELDRNLYSLRIKKAELQVKNTQIETITAEARDTKEEIIVKSQKANEKLYETGDFSKLSVSIDEYYQMIDDADEEIKQALQNNITVKSSNVSSYGWAWPVPYDSAYISSPYGYRSDPATGVYKFHSGIDISMGGAYGKNLIASKSGTVIEVVYSNSGYGNYVIVDHGGDWATLYAHCSSIDVVKGQQVVQGQVIAHIGSSGYSTGPHVHFEIRYDGEQVNPSNYVRKLSTT